MSDQSAGAFASVAQITGAITAARHLERTLNEILSQDELRLDLWRIMGALAERPGMLMGELSASLVIPAPTATRLVDELTDRGLVFRRPAPDDGRKAAVHLSRAGHERLDRASAVVEARLISATTTAGAPT